MSCHACAACIQLHQQKCTCNTAVVQIPACAMLMIRTSENLPRCNLNMNQPDGDSTQAALTVALTGALHWVTSTCTILYIPAELGSVPLWDSMTAASPEVAEAAVREGTRTSKHGDNGFLASRTNTPKCCKLLWLRKPRLYLALLTTACQNAIFAACC